MINIKTIETIVAFIMGAIPFLYVIFITYSIISEASEMNKRPQRAKGGINYDGDISKAVLENAVAEMAVTTVRESGGYIQNNNELIERQLKIFMPNFDSKQFVAFAERLFAKLIKVRGAEPMPLVSDKVNLMYLPYSIACYDGGYLHNYIVCDNTEYLKVFCTVVTEEDEIAESTKESYFLTFRRENPLISLKGGRFLTVSCPNCGGEIDMDKKLVSICPYCHSTVTFAEYDWVLYKIEHIKDDTQICNMAVLKTNKF